MVTTVSETDGLLLLKGGRVLYSSPELAGRVCDCTQASSCCELWAPLREAALACEAGSAEAVGSAVVTLVESDRRRRLEFVLRKATVEGAPMVVATLRPHTQVGRDTLTALANRAALSEHLSAALAKPERPLAVVMIDLDDFKQVNDTAGHLTGDRVLSLAAQRLVGVVRGSDLVARLGGDEFVVVLHDVRSEREVAAFAQRLSAAVGRPYVIGGRHFDLGCSVGAAFAPRDGSTPEQLMQRADAAMYLAKRSGKNRYRSWVEVGGLEATEAVATFEHSQEIPRIGFADVDDAHDYLHSLARRAVELVLQPGGLERGEWRAPTEALLAASAVHFREEEAHLVGSPKLRAHRQAHRVFLAQVEHALHGEWPIPTTSVVALADALADHIATHDVEMCSEAPEERPVALRRLALPGLDDHLGDGRAPHLEAHGRRPFCPRDWPPGRTLFFGNCFVQRGDNSPLRRNHFNRGHELRDRLDRGYWRQRVHVAHATECDSAYLLGPKQHGGFEDPDGERPDRDECSFDTTPSAESLSFDIRLPVPLSSRAAVPMVPRHGGALSTTWPHLGHLRHHRGRARGVGFDVADRGAGAGRPLLKRGARRPWARRRQRG